MSSKLRFEDIVSHSLLEEMSRALRSQWRTLAEKLGFQFKFIQDFEREKDPVYKMLDEWSRTPNATVENLKFALNKINNYTAYALVEQALNGKQFEPQIRQDFSSPSQIQNDNHNHSHQSINPSNEIGVQNAGSGMSPKLREKVDARALCDLHTHLLGMGSPAFWIDTVMRTKIPMYQAEPLTVSFGGSKLVMDNVDAATLNDHDHQRFIPKDEKFQNCVKQSWTWTMDVVFSDIALVQAFLGEDEVTNNTMHRVEERFKGIRSKIKLYLVFNHRSQLFEFRNGVSNTDWMAIIQTHPESRKHLEDAFEIDHDHSIFSVGRFTPEFYPRRYILKDCIYSQHLPVLSDLLRFVLRQYTQNGVGYVEFSVGVNDLCRSWVFRHLVIPRNEAQEERYPMYKFLAAFPRKSTAASALLDWTTAGIPAIIQYIKARNYEKEFPDSFDALEKLQKSLKEKYLLSDYLVGIDWVGDEYNQPFCVFNSEKFLQFVRERRAATNNQFGMRFHCGENMRFNGVPALIHLGIASQVIYDILEKLSDVAPPGTPPVLRIGHGVYFTYKPILEDALDPNVQDWLKMAQILQPGMMALQKHHIVLELNLTSNLFLLSSSIAEHARRLANNFDVIFATDNHGIWSIGNDDCSSVAGELALAVKLNIIPEGSIEAVVDRTRKACFSSMAH